MSAKLGECGGHFGAPADEEPKEVNLSKESQCS